jgi:SAM-dependent methyltransferase
MLREALGVAVKLDTCRRDRIAMRDVDTKIYQAQTALRGWKSAADVIPLFRKEAQWYEWALAKYLPRDKKRAMMLDCGCGAGNFLYFLRSKGYENALGVDIDPKMAAIAKELNMPVQVGDAVEYLRTTSSTYDMIVCFDFLEHLDKDEALEFLQSIYARLKANGVFIKDAMRRWSSGLS